MATDIYDVKDDFRRQDIPSETFAVPYGDHGQHAQDPRIPRFLDDLLATQFRVVFVQSPGNDPRYTRPDGAGAALRGAHGHERPTRCARGSCATTPGSVGR